MAAARKLQQEIDKTLKKVQEGVDVFDNLWEQMQASEYQNQRDKFESELKKEIKRLQRYRDQIKSWCAGSDVKDKKPLMEARRAVEREMERFKAAEREGKTKAFSKEGLIKAQNMSPKDKARQEVRDWMNSTVDKINSQVDELEAELEASAGSSRKKQKSSRSTQIESYVNRHREHINKLENLLRLLDNEQLEPDDFEDIRDFLDDYIERNQEDPEEFEESEEYFYEGVADILESQQLATVTSLNKKQQDKEEKKAKLEKEKEEQRAALEKAEKEKAEAAAAKAAAAKAAAAMSSRQGDSGGTSDKRGAPSYLAQSDPSQGARGLHGDPKDHGHGSRGNGITSREMVKHQTGGMGSWNYGGSGLGVGSSGAFPHPRITPGARGDQKDRLAARADPTSVPMQVNPSASLASLPSFRHNIHSIPQEQDRTWHTQSSGGKSVKALRDPTSYERFDGETLFFAFYYQPGTYNQYLAARALKKKNWRFNKRHNAWFQRLKEPQYVTSEHEQGSYIWFDYHMFHEDGTRGWRPRVKENFVFEYSDLENEVK